MPNNSSCTCHFNSRENSKKGRRTLSWTFKMDEQFGTVTSQEADKHNGKEGG